MLVDALDSDRTVTLHLALDDADDVLAGGLDVEISRDGYTWVRPTFVVSRCDG
jgi:hypothetical protein